VGELRPFVAWDGEGCRNENEESDYQPYCLFGSSLGPRVRRYDLSTLECLSLLMETERMCPEAIHFGYAFDYDVNQIMKDLPIAALRTLRVKNRTRYHGFNIEYIPHKWIQISYGRSKGRGGAGRISLTLYDVFAFFATRLDKSLSKYNIGSEADIQRISAGKGERPNFRYAQIRSEIEPYWETELRLMVELMDKFRGILYEAGYYINKWHGAGALASYCLGRAKVADCLDKSLPDAIRDAARSAYIGGRFQPFKCGYYEGPVYAPDINTAYGYTFSRLPNLQNGKWVHTTEPDRDDTKDRRLGLYHIRYRSGNSGGVKPLPHRDPTGIVSWPAVTEGWFHASEAYLVRNDPKAEFLEGWVFEDDGSYPFAWIDDIYQERLRMQDAGDFTELAHKKAIASFYGQVAQRAGWERRNGPPKYHQLEFAGAITAECRSLVYAAARSAGRGILSIDTDGLLSTTPFRKLPNGIGNQLGQWKCEEYTGVFYVQNGVYWLRDSEGNWLPPKSRGIPQRKLKFEEIFLRASLGENPITINQHQFIGFGTALRGRMHDWRKWLDSPRKLRFGGAGKAIHSERFCPECRAGRGFTDSLHPLIPVPPRQIESTLHHLPWLANSEENPMREHIIDAERFEVV